MELLLEEGGNVEACTRKGITPLHIAAKEGFAEIILQLRDAGADVNVQVGPRLPITFTTCAFGIHGLEKQGKSLKQSCRSDNCPMFLQTHNGITPIYNCRMFLQTHNGITPLHLAILEGFDDIASILVSVGELHPALAMSLRNCVDLAKQTIAHGMLNCLS